MNKYILLSLIFMLKISIVFGQDLSPIATDRPDQTECPFIVPKGYVQAENGLFFEKTDAQTKSMALPTILWRYGISDNFELRLITEVIREKGQNDAKMGLTPVTVGFKVKIMEEKGFFPKTSFIGHLTTPNVATKTFRVPYYAPSFRFTMQHTLSEKLILAYNLGAEWDGIAPEPIFIYTLTTGFSINKKLGSYFEIYGFLPQNQRADHRIDGGLTYLINNNVMIDISGGVRLSSNVPKNFLSLGLSYRFKAKNNN